MRSKFIGGAAAATAVALCLSVPFLQTAKSAQKQATARNDRTENARLIDSIQGPDLYRAYCAVCHGSAGKANGPMAGALKVRPSDLTRISTRNHGAFPLERVQKIISGEVALPSGHGTREMPVWGPIFSQVDRDQDLGRVRVDNLARYLKEMQVK